MVTKVAKAAKKQSDKNTRAEDRAAPPRARPAPSAGEGGYSGRGDAARKRQIDAMTDVSSRGSKGTAKSAVAKTKKKLPSTTKA